MPEKWHEWWLKERKDYAKVETIYQADRSNKEKEDDGGRQGRTYLEMQIENITLTFSRSYLHAPLRSPVSVMWTSSGMSESWSGEVGMGVHVGSRWVEAPEVHSDDTALGVGDTYEDSTYLKPNPGTRT